MSAHAINPSHSNAPSTSSSHGAAGGFAVRLGLFLLLTAVPFGAVMAGLVPYAVRGPAIVVLCFGQLLMQLVWLAHPGTRKDHRENALNFAGTGLVIALALAATQ